MITFEPDELEPQPDPTFLDGFKDLDDRRVAELLVAWAIQSGLRFRRGEGKVRLIEYFVVPEAKYKQGTSGEPLLTLQQPTAKGQWDIPFGRMNGLALGDRSVQRRLFDTLNAVLPAEHQLQEKALERGKDGRTWGQLPYRALHEQKVLADFCGVLALAQKAALAGTTAGYF